MTSLSGIVLAAGAGSRMGMPKALLRSVDGRPWLEIATSLLSAAGCDPVLAVLGAASVEVPPGVITVLAADWQLGMAASIRAGLRSASGDAVLLTLVDLPELPLAVARRVAATPVSSATLRQAVFDGRPGHPVLIGRDHWAALAESVSGDQGGRSYLAANGVEEVECGDLFDGRDVDR